MNSTSERSIWIERHEAEPDPIGNGRLASWIKSKSIDDLRGIVPSAAGVLIEFDARRMDLQDARVRIESLLEQFEAERGVSVESLDVDAPTIMIPVCYDEQVAPDLAWVAERVGCSQDAVIERHSGCAYQVMSMGFMPGFGYLGSLEESLRLARRATPRTRVPAGSVAIAEDMTAVYPYQSAGGWHLIGRTPVCLFDPQRDEPATLRLGDRVRFEPITLAAFHELAATQTRDDR